MQHHNTEDLALGFIIGQSVGKNSGNKSAQGSYDGPSPIGVLIFTAIIGTIGDFILCPLLWSSDTWFGYIVAVVMGIVPLFMFSIATMWIVDEKKADAAREARWREEARQKAEKITSERKRDILSKTRMVDPDASVSQSRDLVAKGQELIAKVAEMQSTIAAIKAKNPHLF